MSQTQQPYQPLNPPSAKPPLVRLSTWVNVVLVLILFASCAANNDNGNGLSGDQIANQVANQLQSQSGSGTPAGPASSAEIEDMCRLLGAVAAKQGVSLTVMSADEMTRCHEVAQEAATGKTP